MILLIKRESSIIARHVYINSHSSKFIIRKLSRSKIFPRSNQIDPLTQSSQPMKPKEMGGERG